jgi:hypothetical protein
VYPRQDRGEDHGAVHRDRRLASGPYRNFIADTDPDVYLSFGLDNVERPSKDSQADSVGLVCAPSSAMPTSSMRTYRSPQFLVPVAAPRRAGRPGAPRRISRSWRGIDLHPRSTSLGAELRLRRRRLLCLWDTSDSTVWRGVLNIFPPFGTCLSTIRVESLG